MATGNSSQMLKGVLEGCLLLIISQKEVYGYQLQQELAAYGLTQVAPGSIYPLLLKMQKEKLIVGQLRASADGPQRKYFRLTTLGQEHCQIFKAEWRQLATSVKRLMGE
ncbi:PadR family transcriptional regulator [Enterococcus nangangensis]|uniref:PadR family transcriptional regulator n=1 Tax=Enterococcus nangangensis TaxID=2559926 RepID=UPI0010F962C8|nr:PadR family transcriptional regulator [Enterococcus nangangensis]